MSSSFLERGARRQSRGAARFLLIALAATPAAWAQQTLFLPGAELSGEWDSNRRLSTAQEDSTSGGRATLDARIRRITPRSDTELHPQVSYQRYSQQSELDSVESHLDLRSKYETLKGRFGLLGRFRRQDALSAELGSGQFDEGGN